MIKNLFLFFAVLGMFAALSRAQVSSVTGQYLQDNNLLINPGFESGIGKWTNSAGTFTADYSVFVQGKASGKVVLSSQNMDFYQDSTLFATQLADGMQAILTVKIKSNVAGVRVCPRQAGVVITSLCVSVQGNDKWGLYQIPFVTGATSQGISINSNSTSITGTVYVDESYVGVSNILNSSSEAKLAGEAYFAGTSSCNWSRTSTTLGAFTSTAACPGPTIVRQSLGAWQTTDADLPRVTVNNLPAGTYKAKFMFRHVLATSGNSAFAINDGTTTCEPQYGATGGLAQYTGLMVECTFNYTSAGNRVFELYAGSTLNAITISNDTAASPRISSKFILEYYGSNSTYTTLNADTDWLSCGLTGSAFTGFGSSVPTPSLQCKRQGSDLLIKGTFQAGTTPTAVEARMSLPTLNGVLLTSASSSVIPSVQLAGNATVNASSTTFFGNYTLIEPSVTYITFSRQDSTRNAYTKSLGTEISSSGSQFSINARVPISGWQNSNLIIGTFNEVMTTPGIAKPKTCYYAFGGASATLASPTNCTTGTCVEIFDSCNSGSAPAFSATGVYNTFSFASGTFANSSHINCDCVGYDTTNAVPKDCRFSFTTGNVPIITNGSGGLTLSNIYTTQPVSGGNTGSNSYVQIRCEGIAP
jgi:hypothetical protein